MKTAPLPPNEAERLKSLEEHRLLDTLPEEVYDDITRIASEICGTPIALLTLLDEKRQWFKSKHNFEPQETSRELSFCAHAILNPNEALVVPDARYDERFHDNPLTTGDSQVVFYAGIPVKDEQGRPLGSLCVIDNRPRELSDQKLDSLKALAKLVNAHFELRKLKWEQERQQQLLQQGHQLSTVIWNEAQQLRQVKDSQGPANSFVNLQQAAENLKRLFDASQP